MLLWVTECTPEFVIFILTLHRSCSHKKNLIYRLHKGCCATLSKVQMNDLSSSFITLSFKHREVYSFFAWQNPWLMMRPQEILVGWINIWRKIVWMKNPVKLFDEFFSPFFVVAVFQQLSHVWLFATRWTAARQAPLSFTMSQSLLKCMSTESLMPPSHLILCHPLLLPPSISPSIRVFSNESVLLIRWPKYWSFSFLFLLAQWSSPIEEELTLVCNSFWYSLSN